MPVTRIRVLFVMLVLLGFMVQTWKGVSRYSGWKSPAGVDVLEPDPVL